MKRKVGGNARSLDGGAAWRAGCLSTLCIRIIYECCHKKCHKHRVLSGHWMPNCASLINLKSLLNSPYMVIDDYYTPCIRNDPIGQLLYIAIDASRATLLQRAPDFPREQQGRGGQDRWPCSCCNHNGPAGARRGTTAGRPVLRWYMPETGLPRRQRRTHPWHRAVRVVTRYSPAYTTPFRRDW